LIFNAIDTIDAALARLRGTAMPANWWAYLAAEAVRALNHATINPGAYSYPGDVYSVIGELQTLAQRLPQALGQAADALEAMDDAGTVVDVEDPDRTPATVVAVAESLANAAGHADSIARELAAAHVPAARLAGTDPTADTERGDR
jgi:hypothetical protein